MRATVVALALLCSACVHPTASGGGAGDGCGAPATPEEIGRCALEEAQRLETEVAAREALIVSLLERLEGAGDTGTGRSLLEEFRRAQHAWLHYKDAECSLAYASAFGAPTRGLDAAICLRDLYRERLARMGSTLERQERSSSSPTVAGAAGADPSGDSRMELNGKHLLFKYESGLEVRGHYHEGRVDWEALSGPARGTSGSEETHVAQIAPHVFFVSWLEKSGTSVSQVLDLEQARVVAFVTFAAGADRLSLFDRGSIAEL